MNDKNKKVEEAKEFFKVFKTPKGKKINVSRYTDEQILRLHKKIEENFKEEYEKAMQKLKKATSNSHEVTKEKRNYAFYNRKSLYDAYKFFAYFDRGYKEGYDVSALTDDEVMKMYLNIKNNYPQTYNSVMEKIRKTIHPRKVAIPVQSILSSSAAVNTTPKNSIDNSGVSNSFETPKKEEEEKALDTLYPEENKDNTENEKLDRIEEKFKKQDLEDKEAAINSLYPKQATEDKDEEDLSKFGLSPDENEKDEPPVKITNKRSIMPDKLTKLVDKFKNDPKFRKKVIITTAVVVGVAAVSIGVAAYTAITGDASAASNFAEGVNEITNAVSQNMDPNTLAAANNFDPSAVNFDLNSINLNDINFDLNNLTDIYSNAGDAANLTGGFTPDPSAGDVYMADLFNNATGKYMNIDPNSLSLDELNELISNGDYSVAYTNNADLIGQGGNKLANAGQITGFGNINDYIDMAKETIQNSKGL